MNVHAEKWKIFGRSSPSPQSYELKEDVTYMEMRIYEVDKHYHKIVKKDYRVTWKAYQKPLESFDKQLVRKFKFATPNLSNDTDLLRSSEAHSLDGSNRHYFIANVFCIDSNRKIWRMNTKKDLLSYILPIDNDADLKKILWLKSYYYPREYRKVQGGYEVKVEDRNEMGTDGRKCGIYTYRIRIDEKSGQIKKKVFEKFKPMVCAQI
jgi:hypothetical protein